MTTIHCTYPDGETSEARLAMPLHTALELYDQYPGYLAVAVYARNGRLVYRHFTAVEAAIAALAHIAAQ